MKAKKLLVLICFFLISAVGLVEKAYSTSIDMLYTNYSIQHTMIEIYTLYSYDSLSIIGSYSNSRSVGLSDNYGLPLSAETQSTHNWVRATSNISLFNVQNSVDADFTQIDLINLPEGRAYAVGTGAETNLSASWGFYPTSSSLEVNLLFSQGLGPYSADLGNFFSVKLLDTTDQTTLISLDSINNAQFFSNNAYILNDYTFSVNPSHIYEFDVFGTGRVWDGNYLRQTVTASITSVPEPATILLLGCGLMGIAGYWRKKFNK